VLDVGGRSSHYTIGLPVDVTITDLPRETDQQHAYRLGLTTQTIDRLRTRRSNVRGVELDDMTRTRLPAASFDCVIAVEVLEHVVDDEAFVRNVATVLRPGGHFVMTTPNGDWKPVPVGDHKRHYRRAQLRELLERGLSEVEVDYAVVAGLARNLGLRGLTARRPIKSLLSMGGNFVNRALSSGRHVRERMHGTHHLIATGVKA
jgi:SAM-dependent methyltransferase